MKNNKRVPFFNLIISDLCSEYGKSDKKLFDCRDIAVYPNLEEIGIIEDFETIGSA